MLFVYLLTEENLHLSDSKIRGEAYMRGLIHGVLTQVLRKRWAYLWGRGAHMQGGGAYRQRNTVLILRVHTRHPKLVFVDHKT